MESPKHYSVLFLVIVLLKTISAQSCNWPTNLQNSVWEDSDKGTLTFTTVGMTGLDFTITGGGTTVDSWNCFVNVDYTTHRIVILESTKTVDIFGTFYKPYVCMELHTVTAHSFYYYVLGEEEVRLDWERLSVRETTQSITTNNAVDELCANRTIGPTVNEYHFLLKSSSVSLAAQPCPQEFQDEFWYSVSDGSSTDCNTQNENWDVCADTTRMQFNYTQCATKVAFSNTGNVICMMSIADGGDLLTTVYNTDVTVDNINTYRFTCFRSTKYTNESMSVSQSPMSCTKDQSSTAIPVHVRTSGNTTGLILALHPHSSSACDPTTTTSTTSTTTTTPTTTSTTTTTTPTTTTTTPTTTTTTPTTTTTTPTTTTSTITTTSTTSTTTTPTTTTTTPTTTSTTTTTPTTTRTSTTTTTTTPTTPTSSTTSTTITTTISSTSTTTTTTAPPDSDNGTDNTMTIIAIALGGVAACLTITLIVVFIFYKCCKRKRPITPEPLKETTPTPSPEPDPTIESMTHTMSGMAALTPRSLLGPRETSILEPGIKRPNTSLFVFPEMKSNDFKITMPTAKEIYSIPPAPWKKFDSTRPGISRSASMLSHRPSPIPEEGSNRSNDRKAQSLRTRQPFLHSEKTSMSINEFVPPVFNTEQRRPSLPKNSVSPVSTPSVDHQFIQQQPITNENHPASPTPSNSKNLTVTPEPSELNKSHVEIPETARPIGITPETEQRVNMKSRLAFVENEHPSDIDQSQSHFNEQLHDNKEQMDKFETNLNSNDDSTTHITSSLFKTIELNEVNASKEVDDVVLMNTPQSYLSSRRGSKGSSTSDMLEVPTSNGKNEGFDANFSRLSPITSTPFENTTPRTNIAENSIGAKIQSVELM